MQILTLIIAYFLLATPNIEEAKSIDPETLNGFWAGEVTQEESADGQVYRSSYELQLLIEEKDGVISGMSYVSVEDIFAKMTISGSFSNQVLVNIKDTKILENKVNPGMEWCIKNYIMILKKENGIWVLEGNWHGKTTFSNCAPGKVRLTKAVDRV